MPMARQQRLGFRPRPGYAAEDFVMGTSNADALAAIHAWPRWHGGCLVLLGSEGVGKTHLARIWAESARAVDIDRLAPDLAAIQDSPVLLEDADQGVEEETLFHLINLAARDGDGLLITAREPPRTWACTLPDLHSRLAALPVVTIGTPDDDVLEGALRKLFRERSIRAPRDLYPYLLTRMERSIPAARELVRRLDEDSRPITRSLAKTLLDDGMENIDLFEG
jgi:chromosomal replication initiation ATPase DnaA